MKTKKEILVPISEVTSTEQNLREISVVNELMNSHKQAKCLTGIIEKCETNINLKGSDVKTCGVVDYKGYKILIPAGEMNFEKMLETLCNENSDYLKIDKEKLYRNWIIAMIGSEIDFKIIGIDVKSKIAVGSRKKACGLKIKKYFLATRGDHGSIMEEAFENGTIVDGRVIGMSNTSLRLEVFGIDVRVPLKELSYRFITTSAMQREFPVGSIVKTKITEIEIDREEQKVVNFTVSIKQAKENTVALNIENYSVGDVVMGKISQVTERGYFISVGDYKTGVDVFCAEINCIDLPDVGDTVSCEIRLIDLTKSRLFGVVKNIIKKRISF